MMNSEQELWRAVIRQALIDATGPKDTLERKQAIDWLTKPNRYFAEACRLADFEPEYIRAKAKAVIESNANADGAARKSGRGKLIEFNGRTQTLTDWAREYAMPFNIVYVRVRSGWSIEQALTTPYTKSRKRAGVAPNFSKNAPDRMSPTAQESM